MIITDDCEKNSLHTLANLATSLIRQFAEAIKGTNSVDTRSFYVTSMF